MNIGRRRGLMLILSSPSGAGKTTLSRRLLDEDQQISLSISVTTRAPRPGETDGVDYRFVSEETFQMMVDADKFLEHASVFGNRYGTPKGPVMERLSEGRDVLFDIDWQGAQQMQDQAEGDIVRVFILPPSLDALKERLVGRGQDSADVVAGRMAKATAEISHWFEYDYVLVNEDVDICLDQLKTILRSERLRRSRCPGVAELAKSLMQDKD